MITVLMRVLLKLVCACDAETGIAAGKRMATGGGISRETRTMTGCGRREREHKKRMDVPDSRIAEDERHKAKQVGLCCLRLSTLLLHVTHVHGSLQHCQR